jgi:hypothetical protein
VIDSNHFSCCECGKVLSKEELREHMVKEHAYKQVGMQVFLRHDCVYCGKPGLYRVGRDGIFCKAHYGEALKRRTYWTKGYLEVKDADMEKKDKKFWRSQDSKLALHKSKQYGYK